MIFSIEMGADYSFYVKSIATYAPAFLGHNNSVLAEVSGQHTFHIFFKLNLLFPIFQIQKTDFNFVF